MYPKNPIIKAKDRYNLKSNLSSRIKEYFFSVIRKSTLNPLPVLISCAYSAKKYVFAQLLGFTSSFMYDIYYILSSGVLGVDAWCGPRDKEGFK